MLSDCCFRLVHNLQQQIESLEDQMLDWCMAQVHWCMVSELERGSALFSLMFTYVAFTKVYYWLNCSCYCDSIWTLMCFMPTHTYTLHTHTHIQMSCWWQLERKGWGREMELSWVLPKVCTPACLDWTNSLDPLAIFQRWAHTLYLYTMQAATIHQCLLLSLHL